ncbi:hypothetical protein HZA99_01795 [Candidatus Woesearchaeota archaeon]|nr:hypothetical protein [Candidatus Woesearchaeota archaeon]
MVSQQMKKIKMQKKADMNFWLVMLVLALIFMVIMFFVMNKAFTNWGKTTGGVQTQIDTKTDEAQKEGLFGFTSDSSSGSSSTSQGTG